jgi:hypothetical protein
MLCQRRPNLVQATAIIFSVIAVFEKYDNVRY